MFQTIFPRYGLYVVGSTMSGFGLDSSDMDLCLYVRPVDELEPRAHALLHLNYILSYIRSFDPSQYTPRYTPTGGPTQGHA